MKKFFAAFCLLFLLVCLTPLTAFADNVPQKVLDASSSVVYIEVESGTMISAGSGFIIKNDDDGTYIVTNNHVIDLNPSGVLVWTAEDEKRSATVVASSAQYDLAVLKIPDSLGADALSLSDEAARGDEIYAVGFPFAANYLSDNIAHFSSEVTITNGIISSIRTRESDSGPTVKILQINADINAGNSGGPLLNRDGEVVGINTYGASDSQGIFGAIAASDLIRFLDDKNLPYSIAVKKEFPYWLIIAAGAGGIIIFFILIIIRKLKKRSKTRGKTELILSEYLSKLGKPVSPGLAVSLLMPVALQLREKHNQGTVYLKLSPASISVNPAGSHLRDSHDTATDDFYAPEQKSGAYAGIRADVFGVCALLRYMLNYHHTMNLSEEASDTAADPLFEIIGKGLAEKPEDRYGSMQELILELAPFNTGIPEEALIPFNPSQKENKVKETRQKVMRNRSQNVAAMPVPKKRKLVAILVPSCIGFVVCAAFGYFALTYFTAIHQADQYDFMNAYDTFHRIPYASDIFPTDSCYIESGVKMAESKYDEAIAELSKLTEYKGRDEQLQGLMNEINYRKAASLAEQGMYDEAIKLYQQLGAYKDSGKLVGDTAFRKACYLIDTSEFEEALRILEDLYQQNYIEAEGKIPELYYIWGIKLIESEEYLDAYKKLLLAGEYPDAKAIIADIKLTVYNTAINFYRQKRYARALEWFNAIDAYADSPSYLKLLNARLGQSITRDQYNELCALIEFEDAAQVLVSKDHIAKLFLEGTWRNGSKYLRFKSSGIVTFNFGTTFFSGGTYRVVGEGSIKIINHNCSAMVFHITVISENCIQIITDEIGGSRTYTLYRE